MNPSPAFSPEQIHAAAEALQRLRPAYVKLLRFYEKIFTAQEASKQGVKLEPFQISSELRAIKHREKLPLVDVTDFTFDLPSARDLLIKICAIIQSDNREISAAAEAIVRGLDREIKPQALFNSLLKGDDAYFEKTAVALNTAKAALAFVAYNSLKPSVTLFAEQLAIYVEDITVWEKGYCPVCGNFPGLAVLDHDGRRFLHCSFCWTVWPAKRVFCPFCEKTGGKNLLSLYSDQEKDLRVDVCGDCKKYLKAVDSRATARIIYPPMEQIASLHLDILAQQKGYESGMELVLPDASE
ncbi:MAG: formate dehydrogenase accessory protein FdhE [Deltaproteobacteria bacterium]|nr:formate dehydrogenase accessory protein FdhE [Deltaproteobacteria bacterium]